MSTPETRVDFYLLAGHNLGHLHLFCCRLAEKAWKLGNRVWIRTADEHETRLLDDLLWSFSEGSFLPHATDTSAEAGASPVIVGQNISQHTAQHDFDLLINLAHDVPAQAGHIPRIAEILNDDETLKNLGRARYSTYVKNNYTLKHHTINA